MPAVGALLGLEAWRLAAAWEPRTATIADAVVVAAAAIGALVAAALTASAMALALTPARSRVRRLASRATPAPWRRIVAIALTGAAAAGVALPAAAASTPPDPTGDHATASEAGWIEAPAPEARTAGWVAPSRTPEVAATASTPLESPPSAPRDSAPEPDPDPTVAASDPEPDQARHRVAHGESLWSITAHERGGTDAQIAAAWPDLYAVNRDTIGDDPSLIHPGDELTLPAGWQR